MRLRVSHGEGNHECAYRSGVEWSRGFGSYASRAELKFNSLQARVWLMRQHVLELTGRVTWWQHACSADLQSTMFGKFLRWKGFSTACRMQFGDTADYKSALRASSASISFGAFAVLTMHFRPGKAWRSVLVQAAASSLRIQTPSKR